MDLTTMMRDQAKAGLQARLDQAVADGNAEAARKISDEMATLAVQTAPKAAPFTSADVWKAAEAKADWLGIDPKKSALANEFAKTMNPARFKSAEDMAAAVLKAVEDETKPAGTTEKKEPPENETDEERETREAEEAAAAEEAEAGKTKPATRRTNGPDATGAGNNRRAASGPWTKLSDAPADIQKEVRRAADRFVPAKAPKEQRERYIITALASHYAAHQRKTGKK